MRRLLGFLIVVTSARADIANGEFFPIGDRTAFMANTACADGKSSMAVLFNPGALGFVEKSKIALSGNLYFNLTTKFDPLVRYQGEAQAVSISGFNSVPNSAVSIYKWGETTLAISVLVPEYFQAGGLKRVNLTGYNAVLQFDTRQQDLWLGGTVARVWGGKYGVGISAFGTRYTAYDAISIAGNYVVGGNSVMANSISHKEGAAHSVEVALGFFWKPSPGIATGIRFSPPGISLGGTGSYYSSTSLVTGATQVLSVEDRPALKYVYRRPAQLSLGGQLELLQHLKWYTDVNFQFPLSFEQFPGASQPGPIDLQATVRLSTGFAYELSTSWSLLSGFGYFPSAVPAVEPRYAGQARTTGYLLTGGFVYSDEHVRTGLGGFYLMMDGTQQVDATVGNTSQIETRALGALLTSSYEF